MRYHAFAGAGPAPGWAAMSPSNRRTWPSHSPFPPRPSRRQASWAILVASARRPSRRYAPPSATTWQLLVGRLAFTPRIEDGQTLYEFKGAGSLEPIVQGEP